jgi:hypothetical protein
VTCIQWANTSTIIAAWGQPLTTFTKYCKHQVQHTPCTALTVYCIHCELHHPIMDCLPLPAGLSSLGKPCCTQFSTFPKLQVHQCIESQLPSCLPPELPPSHLPPPITGPISLAHGLQVHLQSYSIMAPRWVSKLSRSKAPIISPNSIDYGLNVQMIMTLTCISPISVDHGL